MMKENKFFSNFKEKMKNIALYVLAVIIVIFGPIYKGIKFVAKKIYQLLAPLIKKLKTKYKSLKPQARKKVNLAGGVFTLVLIITLSVFSFLPSGNVVPTTSTNIVFGNPTVEVVNEVTPDGGVVTVSDNNSLVDGLKITVPQDAYNMPLDFVVKTYPVVSHKFGNNFNLITPIIEVNNGHDFANETMLVEVPILKTDNEFAMGFYYNEEDDSLEAIPTVELTNEKIVLAVKHFSKIVVGDISLTEMMNLTQNPSGNLDTGFQPALDDWHYVNYGSQIASGGHCAGQSLTMSWYYSEKFVKENEPRLFGRFDNNEEMDTSNFWQDDNNAYRFSSVIQDAVDFSFSEWMDFINYSVNNPKNVFYAFAYAINVTNTPQLMAIFPANFGMGHAIVAYKVEDNKIYVADPNFPGQTDRYVEYDPVNNVFNPYSSGANASDISTNGATAYTNIVYVAKSALINYELISENYNKLLNNTVGDNEFSQTVVEVLTKFDANPANFEWSRIEREINLGNSYANSLTASLQNKGLIAVTPQASNMAYSIYLGGNIEPEQNPTVDSDGSSLFYEVDLVEGANEFAFLVEYEDNGYYYYVDFIRIRINYSTQALSSVISFNSNGGSVISPITAPIGSSVQEPTAPVKEGYTFAGWFTDVNFLNAYSFSTIPNANITLYAKWVSDNILENIEGKYYLYTIDGSSNLGAIDYQYYEVLNNGTYSEVTKLVGQLETTVNGTWTLLLDKLTFNNGSATYEVIVENEFLKDLPTESPYFIYKKQPNINTLVTITFNSSGGSQVNAITQKANTTVVEPQAPTKKNNFFDGWYEEETFITPFVFNVMPNKDITLYAKWSSEQSTTVKIACAFHSNYVYNPAIYTEEHAIGDAFPYDFVDGWRQDKSGHKFGGYYIDNQFTTPLTFTNVPSEDVYIYINWIPLTDSEIYVKYDSASLRSDLEYHYIIFNQNGTFSTYYKYLNSATHYQSPGTFTVIRNENGLSFYADYDSSAFPVNFVVYEDSLYSSEGSWVKAID